MIVRETNASKSSSVAFDGSIGELYYIIQLAAGEDETDALDYVIANAPLTFEAASGTSYNRQKVSVKPGDEGNGIVRVEVLYQQAKPLQFTFQTGGGSEKVDFSRESVHNYTVAGKDQPGTPDYQQGINVTKNSIEGLTIRTANFQFKLTKSWAKPDPIDAFGTFSARTAHDGEADGYRYLSTDGDGSTVFTPILYERVASAWAEDAHVTGVIDGAYLSDVEAMTSKYNAAAVTIIVDGLWMHFLAGELFFDGTDGGKSVDDRFELTYTFSVSRNIVESDLDSHRNVGAIAITEKRGWDVIWIASEQVEDAEVLIREPTAAYVERVYDEADFDDLRLTE